MKKEQSEIENDYNWLVSNGYTGINLQQFSDWVTRDLSDSNDSGINPILDEIRMNVIEKMKG